MHRWHPLPARVHALVEDEPATVLLECAPPGDPEPYSRLFTSPLREFPADQPEQLPELFAAIESAVAAGHYVAGFFTYECGAAFEPAAAMRPAAEGQPLAWFGVYRRCYLFDHRTGAFVDGDPPGLAQYPPAYPDYGGVCEAQPGAVFGLTGEQYSRRIAAIHRWIRAGDVYQLNFTVPLRLQALGSPAALYRRLRSRQPVEYGAFLHWRAERRILSFSPELFFRLEERDGRRHITTRPMKGTAPRGRTTREDRKIAEWLCSDPKNRAENVMIVDLLRNDLGRLCRYGSVRAENLFAAERYQTLWQMTSTVTGELRPEAGFQQIFRALFPCGSITGAPKVRAMQLLAKIEDQPRGVYTGAIGYFSRERTVFSVAIRTLEMDGRRGTMGVGSGIVIDSDAGEEFRECQLKAEFLTRPTDSFSLVETLLWQDGYPLLGLHLDRLQDSADYFDFPCDRGEVQAALLDYAVPFTNSRASITSKELCVPSFRLIPGERVGSHEARATTAPRKVRLLLDPDGALRITCEPLSAVSFPAVAPLGRVRIASRRTDPQDRMLFHKTTHRPVYAQAFESATQAGFDDVLFLNQRGEVTEGAISNIFVEKDGRWFTPPVECGLLAGVYRRHLLETHPGVEERVLHLEDLRQADAIYLANAVRGLRRVVIDWEDG
jgi:para-aminobenzoate synthetase/4-amino-4-deoxychorismate lyase